MWLHNNFFRKYSNAGDTNQDNAFYMYNKVCKFDSGNPVILVRFMLSKALELIKTGHLFGVDVIYIDFIYIDFSRAFNSVVH